MGGLSSHTFNSGEARAHVALPGMEFVGQGLGFFRQAGGEVAGFSDVRAEVVQFDPAVFKKLDELPVAVADGRARAASLVAIMRIVPIQRPVRESAPAHQQGHQAHAVDMLRQHVRPEVRMHGIISRGGAAPNIVPETASARFYFRAPRRDELNGILDQVHDCARGAALATGTEAEWHHFELSFDDVLPNGPAEAMMEEVFRELGVPLSPAPGPLGSSDVGNVSYRCPTIQPEMDIAGRDVAGHTREFAAAVIGPRAHEALVTGARALAYAVLRTFSDADLRRRMREAFEAHRLR